jgi:serine/threonine-protein kinase
MIWSNDGQRITYGSVNDGAFTLWERRGDGSGDPVKLYSSPDSRTLLVPNAWSPDGKALVFIQVDMSTDQADVYVLERAAGSNTWAAKPYLKTPANEVLSGFSPDGKWAMVGSSQSGRDELYVQRFTGESDADAKGGRVPISSTGVRASWWSPDGKEIRYIDSDSQVISVQVKLEPAFAASEPKVLYSIKELKTRSFTFAPDGKLMVVLQGESERTTRKVDLIVNFVDELRAKMPVAR